MNVEFIYKTLAGYIEDCGAETDYDYVAVLVRTCDGHEYKGGVCRNYIKHIITDHVLFMNECFTKDNDERCVFIDASSIIMLTFEFEQ